GINFLTIRGSVKGITARQDVTVGALSNTFSSKITSALSVIQNTSVVSGEPNYSRIRINTNGTIVIERTSIASPTSGQWYPIDCRQSLHTNFLRTEDFVNDFAEQFRYHKTEELNAHGSKQISDERFKTVERGLNVINSRYDNLILSKGKNSLQEVKDARVDSE